MAYISQRGVHWRAPQATPAPLQFHFFVSATADDNS